MSQSLCQAIWQRTQIKNNYVLLIGSTKLSLFINVFF